MPPERLPTTPESIRPKTLTPEKKDTKELEKEALEKSIKDIESYLCPQNQESLKKMPAGGKKIISQIYEGLYKIPGVNRIVGKLEISYNQFWLDKHEKRAVDLKGKIDGLDMQIGTLDQSKKEIESVIEDLKQQKIPGVESLQLKLKDIDRQKIDSLNKKDKIQSEFESRENKVKLYANKRDKIANKLIEHYDEKLMPMEKELKRLHSHVKHIDLLIAVTKEKHRDLLSGLDHIEKQKTKIEELLRKNGMPEKEIKKDVTIKKLENLLIQGRKKIKAENDILTQKKDEINSKIAKIDAKANQHRDKRGEFIRVKEGRPLNIPMETRKKEEEFKGREETKGHIREESPETTGINKEPLQETKPETIGKNKEKLEVSSLISGWNKYLKEKYNEEVSGELVDLDDFLERINHLFKKDDKISFEGFKDILENYYKCKDIPLDKFNENIDDFIKAEKKKKEEELKNGEKTNNNNETIAKTNETPSKEVETAEEGLEQKEVSSFTHGWNEYLNEKYKQQTPEKLVILKDFLADNKMLEDTKLSFEDFKKILKEYYHSKNIEIDKLDEDIDEFFEKKLKTKK